LRGIVVLCGALALSACATLTPGQRERAAAVASAARSQQTTCNAVDACAQASPLRDLAARAFAESTPEQPRHYALILDRGSDALLARINLIRSATTAIDLQTYIFSEDDAGRFVLDELLTAARRGVRVRLLMDQLAALEHIDTLAALSGAHANLEVRLYNPMLDRARINYPQFVLAAACCWRKLNQRMHTKLLLVDGAVGIAGGRNYQDDYYDWDGEYNFRDRDVLVAGPAARAMDADFEQFWTDRRSVPAERLTDVGARLLRGGVPALPAMEFERPQRAAAMRAAAADPAEVQARLAAHALPVGVVRYISDSPEKHRGDDAVANANATASQSLRGLIESAHEEVMLQTPYLVLSKPAQQMFRDLHKRVDAPRVIISTNSLAATDAFIAYALSYKYKRRFLRDFGFNIYEYKPFPADAPIDIADTGTALPEFAPAQPRTPAPSAAGHHQQKRYDNRSVTGRAGYRNGRSREYGAMRYGSRRANQPVPLQRAGVRIGMHAKSLVIDERIGVIGTHNFDPRSDNYNTESAVVIEDAAFARALSDSIRRDISPENSWVIGPRDKPPVFSGLEYSLAKMSEQLPLFDLWPTRYATSYEFVPGPTCPQPLPPDHPGFRACYKPVGDFPEVDVGLKSLTTRIFTAFGAGLAPIL
jgi:phosphatidylserine/phosphatidylglycerophosphate/cardiolipin synthase-like enzyme